MQSLFAGTKIEKVSPTEAIMDKNRPVTCFVWYFPKNACCDTPKDCQHNLCVHVCARANLAWMRRQQNELQDFNPLEIHMINRLMKSFLWIKSSLFSTMTEAGTVVVHISGTHIQLWRNKVISDKIGHKILYFQNSQKNHRINRKVSTRCHKNCIKTFNFTIIINCKQNGKKKNNCKYLVDFVWYICKTKLIAAQTFVCASNRILVEKCSRRIARDIDKYAENCVYCIVLSDDGAQW